MIKISFPKKISEQNFKIENFDIKINIFVF